MNGQRGRDLWGLPRLEEHLSVRSGLFVCDEILMFVAAQQAGRSVPDWLKRAREKRDAAHMHSDFGSGRAVHVQPHYKGAREPSTLVARGYLRCFGAESRRLIIPGALPFRQTQHRLAWRLPWLRSCSTAMMFRQIHCVATPSAPSPAADTTDCETQMEQLTQTLRLQSCLNESRCCP